MWKGWEAIEVEPDLAEQLVEPEHVRTLAAILIKVRRLPRGIRHGAMQIWLAPHAIVDVVVVEAALARLRAASLLDLGAKLEEFSVEALTEAIAFTPLHPSASIIISTWMNS
jgi:hypothetical protein